MLLYCHNLPPTNETIGLRIPCESTVITVNQLRVRDERFRHQLGDFLLLAKRPLLLFPSKPKQAKFGVFSTMCLSQSSCMLCISCIPIFSIMYEVKETLSPLWNR